MVSAEATEVFQLLIMVREEGRDEDKLFTCQQASRGILVTITAYRANGLEDGGGLAFVTLISIGETVTIGRNDVQERN